MSDQPENDDDDALAAELALRLLDGAELDAARARALRDPDFARRVGEWEMRLAAMADAVTPQDPGPAAKAALMDSLFGKPVKASFWARLWVWRGLAGASLATAALLAFLLVGSAPPQPGGGTPGVQATQIVSQAGDFRALVVLDRTANALYLTRLEGAAPPGRVLQFWAHGPGEPAMSVGLVPDTPTARFALPDFLQRADYPLTFGVSEEPPGGSPTGRPSGRVFGTADIGM